MNLKINFQKISNKTKKMNKISLEALCKFSRISSLLKHYSNEKSIDFLRNQIKILKINKKFRIIP